MIDLHAHILPGVDDGPPTLPDAIAMARAAVASGITTMAATSHVAHEISVVPSEVAARVAGVNREFAALGIALEVVVGGEIAMSRVADLGEEDLMALRLGGGPFLLVEAPLSPAVGDFDPLLFDLQARGHRVLLAHPERSPSFHRRPDRLDALVAGGVVLQVTASAFEGRFGDTVRRFSVELMKRGLVGLLASDAHDAVRRPPEMVPGFAAAKRWVPGLTDEHLDHFCRAVPAAVLGRAPMPEPPPLAVKEPFWRRLARRDPLP